MKVRFYLDSNKSVKTKEKTIWCYVREYGDTLALNTGEWINPELWDKINQRANLRKTKDKILKGSLKNVNLYLNSYENKVYEVARNIRMKEFNAGFSLIADELRKQFNKRDTSFFAVYDEFLKDAQKITMINQRAAEMAQGDPVIEEALKAHFAFTGLPSENKRYSIN